MTYSELLDKKAPVGGLDFIQTVLYRACGYSNAVAVSVCRRNVTREGLLKSMQIYLLKHKICFMDLIACFSIAEYKSVGILITGFHRCNYYTYSIIAGNAICILEQNNSVVVNGNAIAIGIKDNYNKIEYVR